MVDGKVIELTEPVSALLCIRIEPIEFLKGDWMATSSMRDTGSADSRIAIPPWSTRWRESILSARSFF
jgi:hypothetical protein